MVYKLFVAADLFNCTQSHCESLRLVNVFSIAEKLDLVAP